MNENNMNMCKITIKLIMALVVAFGITSCDNHEQTANIKGIHTYRMRLQGGCGSFDESTRSTYTWAQDDVIYLRFRVGESWVHGKAVYDLDSGLWTVKTNFSLTSNEEMECHSVFILRPGSITTKTDSDGNIVVDVVGDPLYKVNLSKQSIVYTDEEASYLLQDGELTVTSYLMPRTGRIQIRGESEQSFTINGLSFLTTYDVETGMFTTSNDKFTSYTLIDGYSEFYYAAFADEELRKLTFYHTNLEFCRSFGINVLRAGESGYITIPTIDSHEGWTVIDPNSSIELSRPALGEITIVSVHSKYAKFSATITHDGNTPLTNTGFVLSNTPNPTLTDTTIKTTTSTSISGEVFNLQPQTNYYVRAYATNILGTTYSEQISFTTLSEEEDTSIKRDDFESDTILNNTGETDAKIEREQWGDDENWN